MYSLTANLTSTLTEDTVFAWLLYRCIFAFSSLKQTRKGWVYNQRHLICTAQCTVCSRPLLCLPADLTPSQCKSSWNCSPLVESPAWWSLPSLYPLQGPCAHAHTNTKHTLVLPVQTQWAPPPPYPNLNGWMTCSDDVYSSHCCT